MYVMLLHWNGQSALFLVFSLNYVRNALFQTFAGPYAHSSKSDHGFGDIIQEVLVPFVRLLNTFTPYQSTKFQLCLAVTKYQQISYSYDQQYSYSS